MDVLVQNTVCVCICIYIYIYSSTHRCTLICEIHMMMKHMYIPTNEFMFKYIYIYVQT